jgi:two-component system phosphate regulon sensor histidine kinase PhoR
MKFSRILSLFIIALFSLLCLQAVWLNNTYQLKLSEMKELVNKFFMDANENELQIRFLETENRKFPENTKIPVVSFNEDEIKQENVKSFWFRSTQVFSAAMGVPFDIKSLDSIYSSILAENHLPVKFRLVYTDSLNHIIETTGGEIVKGFETEHIPILNGNQVQAIAKISFPVVFKNMVEILAVSVFILFIILICLIYEIRMFFTQQHLEQIRENFTHALTHDMKTPLNSVLTILNQIRQGALENQSELQNQFLDIGIEQTLNLQAMVNKVLVTAYANHKVLALKKDSVDIVKMVNFLITNFKLKNDKDIRFTTKYDLNDTLVYADDFYLRNVISNLFDNAIKYSGESVQIDFECTASDKQIYIRIKDNGWGISPADQEKIFERFERGAEIKRNRASGFGLGLNYVKKVIEAHGGIIALTSKEGLGSEFIITLPVLFTSINSDFFDSEENKQE